MKALAFVGWRKGSRLARLYIPSKTCCTFWRTLPELSTLCCQFRQLELPKYLRLTVLGLQLDSTHEQMLEPLRLGSTSGRSRMN